ncbi:diguanylate cyclase (GGDEF) domain-containing protein [Natronincola peptidivorans]|uniref:Diguanylate cyclase (GGDEF) domain-containing protein n=1 Tax=Natronincola peptidivorans TaxID=426128 RepID=A0A1I0C5M7_9FIRM|nr:bifunctional diguanylate cyclase/phosphodiesterase [Natronincola peptidivorans]SET14839.1 diguanylate cyclase (GGDEF) domain-containing protein [Natronincola peptidivorans]
MLKKGINKQKNNLNKYFFNGSIDKVVQDRKNGIAQWAKISLCIFIYITMSFILRQMSSLEAPQIVFRDMVLNYNVLNGVFAQIQVMISVYLVVRYSKHGYFIGLLLNIYGALSAAVGFFVHGSAVALPGITINVGTAIIITIISIFQQSLYNKIKEIGSQKDELVLLYEEVRASREKLHQQNKQLIESNQVIKRNEERLVHLASFDALTGLPNRKIIIERLDKLTNFQLNQKTTFAVVFIDLDNFKKINDSMGHHVGDQLLQLIVKRWKLMIHESDMLGRLGGDEFALIIQRKLEKNEIFSYVESLRTALQDALLFKTKKFYITASYGISIYPQDGFNSIELLKSADIAMYKVKNQGKNGIQFFSQNMQSEILQKIKIENGIQSALNNNELFLVFQPQYSCSLKSLRGFEALVRWESSELGVVSPAEFIPVVEETGQIVQIGEWILRDALRKFKAMQDSDHMDSILSINISVVQIIESSFVEMVQKALDDIGFETKYLEFEITESVFISFPDHVIEVINQLKKMGIRIALDDFGAGYTALKYLQMFPLDTLKIDKTFTDSIDEKSKENHIMSSIISLAHQLDIEVVAEGVENTTQLNYLTEQKCDYIQGFLLSKPLNYHEMIQLSNDRDDSVDSIIYGYKIS